jgi:transposase
VWWSRLARPALHAWSDDGSPRLTTLSATRDDPEPKALACYGLLVRQDETSEALWVRFVDERPVSALTEQFVTWICTQLAATGTTTLVLVWDNASWHISQRVRTWLRTHNQRVLREGGVRLVPCWLPTKSPWLNPIEPKWVHAKRRIVEPTRVLTAHEVEQRVCAAFACPRYDHLIIPQEVA